MKGKANELNGKTNDKTQLEEKTQIAKPAMLA